MTNPAPAVLTYFRGRGRAETTRWMLAAIGRSFVNQPVTTAAALADLRASGRLPFDQLPLLEIDGLRLSQTTALIRHLARLGGLMPADPFAATMADMVAGVAADLAEFPMQAAFRPSEMAVQQSLADGLAKFGPKLERHLLTHGTGHVAGGTLSFADVVLAEALTGYDELAPGCLAPYPHLAALQRRVTTLPALAHMPDPHRFVIGR
jgi:glutathione S-transferase